MVVSEGRNFLNPVIGWIGDNLVGSLKLTAAGCGVLMFVIGPSRGKPKMAKITSKCRHITLRQHKTDDNFK